MIDNPIIFYLAAFFILGFALLALFAKNVIYSLLYSILVFFFGALFFYILGSEYNAIIQAAIYGLAVPVIIGVSIMFTKGDKYERKKSYTVPYITLMCSGVFVLAFIYLMLISLTINPDTFSIVGISQVNDFDRIFIFSKGLFVNYVWAFELVSLLLTIVIAGISLINTKRGRE